MMESCNYDMEGVFYCKVLTTLNSHIVVGHINFLEPMLVLIIRVNVGHIDCFLES